MGRGCHKGIYLYKARSLWYTNSATMPSQMYMPQRELTEIQLSFCGAIGAIVRGGAIIFKTKPVQREMF